MEKLLIDLIEDFTASKNDARYKEKSTTDGVNSEEYYRGKAEAYTDVIGWLNIQLNKKTQVSVLKEIEE